MFHVKHFRENYKKTTRYSRTLLSLEINLDLARNVSRETF